MMSLETLLLKLVNSRRALLISILLGIFVIVTLIFSLDLPNRFWRGENSQKAIESLDLLHGPLLAIKEAENQLVKTGDKQAATLQLDKAINTSNLILARYQKLAAYNPLLAKHVDLLSKAYESWLTIERHFFIHDAQLDTDLESEKHYLEIVRNSTEGFLMIMRFFGEEEALMHQDIAQGRNATHLLMLFFGLFFIYLIILISFQQMMKKRELAKSESYFRNLLNQLKEEIVVLTPDYLISDVNKTFLLASGYPRENVIGHHCYEISHGYDQPCNLMGETCLLQEVFNTGIPHTCIHQHHQDHSKIWADIMLSPLKDERGRVIAVIESVRDITGRKKAEAELRIKESAIESSINAVLLSDLDGNLTYVNHAFCQLWGCENRKDVLDHKLAEFWLEPKKITEIFKVLYEIGGWQGELKALKKDGSPFDAQISLTLVKDDSRQPVCLMGSIIDISEQKAAEAQLLANLHHLTSMQTISRLINQTLELGKTLTALAEELLTIFQCDRAWLLYPLDPATPAFRVPVEVTRPEYPGLSTTDMEAPMNPVLSEMMITILASNEPITYSPATRPVPGVEVHTKFSTKSQMIIALRPKTGKPWALGMHQCSHAREWTTAEQELFKDIADKVADVLNNLLLYRDLQRSEEELRDAKSELECQYEELEELDKMKDGLLRDVTHELKTPVAKQRMQLEILRRILEKHNLQTEGAKVLQTMDSSIVRQESMIRNILDLSRLEAGGRKYNFEPVNLDQVIEEVLADYQFEIEALQVEVVKHLEKVELKSDHEMLCRIFSNIVNNALKYHNPATPPRLDILLTKAENWAVIKIRDNGIGIKPEEMPRIFDRFYQASISAEGIGVGLTVSRFIVHDLGGKIWLESGGVNQGTTAVVELPLTEIESTSMSGNDYHI